MSHTRLPAEWEPQSAVQLTWPHAATGFGPWLADVVPVFVAIGRAVLQFQELIVACHDAAVQAEVEALLGPSARLHTVITGSDDVWSRDHGPITVFADGPTTASKRLALDFRFTGWGGKFPAAQDDVIPQRLARHGSERVKALLGPVEVIDWVLEGGAIESDGLGTVLTTESVLLNPNRTSLDRAGVEARLAQHLGAQRVLWLAHGHLEGDDTDGHVDTLARLCDPSTIAYVACDDPADAHYDGLAAMAAELAALRSVSGAPYRLVPLPWPRAVFDDEGARLPLTYANFLILNGAVLVPTYRDPADERALATLRPLFPGREVIGIDCLPLVYQYGSLHCATMQLPAVPA